MADLSVRIARLEETERRRAIVRARAILHAVSDAEVGGEPTFSVRLVGGFLVLFGFRSA